MDMDRVKTLESIFKKDLSLLFYICSRYPVPKDMHMDFIQESILITLDKIKKIKNDTYGGIRSYLITILKHKCIDYLKKEQKIVTHTNKRENNDEDPINDLPDKNPNPIQQIILGEEKRLHQLVMTKLKPKYQPVLDLTFDGHKPGKIAEMLNKNPSTVREYKMKGLEEYKKIMRKLTPV